MHLEFDRLSGERAAEPRRAGHTENFSQILGDRDHGWGGGVRQLAATIKDHANTGAR
jgi:hypothetical protein